MRVWRLVRKPYADLSGLGAARYPGRWNAKGQRVVYTAEHPALAVLEVRVHLGLHFDELPLDYVFMEIDLSGASLEMHTRAGNGHADKRFGSAWLREGRSAILGVPSVLVPYAKNYLINPLHADAAAVELAGLTAFAFDERLFKGARAR